MLITKVQWFNGGKKQMKNVAIVTFKFCDNNTYGCN